MVSKSKATKIQSFFRTREFLALFVLFILFCIALLVVPFWGTAKINEFSSANFYFNEYDKLIDENNQFCFSFSIDTQSTKVHEDRISVFVNQNVIFSEPIVIVAENSDQELFNYYGGIKKNYCFDSFYLNDGNNVVSVSLGSQKLFYHIQKVDLLVEPITKLEIIDINSEGVLFNLDLKNYDSFKPLMISINDKEIQKIYPGQGNKDYFEKIDFVEGQNKINLSFNGVSISKEYFYTPQIKMNPIIGFLFFILIMGIFSLFVFSKKSFIEKSALSLMSAFALIVSTGFILNFFKMLNLFSFLFLNLLILLLLFFVFKNNYSSKTFSLEDKQKIISPIFVVIILGAILLPLFINFFTVSNFSYWNTYYERHAESLAENFELPIIDELSYFGRPLGFIPGYFYLQSGFSWIFGVSGQELFSLGLIIANIFFIFAVLMLGESLGFSRNKSAILYVLLWMENFIRTGLIISPRHAFSFGLFIVALSLVLSNRSKLKEKILSSISLAICGFIQFPLFVAFIPLYLIVAKKIELKKVIIIWLVAGAIFLLFFVPNFLNFGFPTQAESSNWGYLINYDAVNILLDFGPMFVFFFLFTIFDLKERKFSLLGYEKKLFIGVILGLLFQIFISYRWNIFNAINFAVFLVILIPEKAFESKYFIRVIAIIMLFVGLISGSTIGYLSITNYLTEPYDFLSKNSSSTERILSDPLFSHDITYFTNRSVMADLAVEYAPEEMLQENFKFLEEKDYSIIDKYNINWVFSQKNFINRKAFGNKPLDYELEFEKLDKVFSNALINIHWNSKNQ